MRATREMVAKTITLFKNHVLFSLECDTVERSLFIQPYRPWIASGSGPGTEDPGHCRSGFHEDFSFPMCPDLVMAAENPAITVEAYDLNHFPDLREHSTRL
ncbi:hypothetical protein Holit_00054 [Hollandina sp. SP2]